MIYRQWTNHSVTDASMKREEFKKRKDQGKKDKFEVPAIKNAAKRPFLSEEKNMFLSINEKSGSDSDQYFSDENVTSKK